jgi:hypothetical protein
MLPQPREINAERIKDLKKLSLQIVPLLPDDRREAEYVLGIVGVHIAFLNEHKLLGEIEQTSIDNRVLEFRRAACLDR